MHVKIINPKTNGRVVYSNKGSSLRLANYLSKEAKSEGLDIRFFGLEGAAESTAQQVVARLDNNHKGLTKDADKFHSLVLSPSAAELAHIGNSSAKLEEYTRQVMAQYAQNFHLKNGQVLGEKDLVWAATVHYERKNRGTDGGEQGQPKAGLQTHVHVVVSARDAAQKVTLNPQGLAARFNRVAFQAQANVQFEEQFGRVVAGEIGVKVGGRKERVNEKIIDITERAASAKREKKSLTEEQMAAKNVRLDAQVSRLNDKLHESLQLDAGRVKEIARTREYDNTFYHCLGKMERNAERGVHTPEPYDYLSTGKLSKGISLDMRAGIGPPVPPELPPREPLPPSAMYTALSRRVQELAQALEGRTHTQDVRSEAEKAQDYEYGW